MSFAATIGVTIAAAVAFSAFSGQVAADPQSWRQEWTKTDFSKHTVAFAEIKSGGPSKDGIPAIDVPRFEQLDGRRAAGWARNILDNEAVISLVVAGDARAYPVQILIWHEIVNDVAGGAAIVITYCPLCNSGLVFARTVDGRVLDFGTTGKLRNSDLVMYDRQTESWWQQFTGEAIIGSLSGRSLRPIRLEWSPFRDSVNAFRTGKCLFQRFLTRGTTEQILTSDMTP